MSFDSFMKAYKISETKKYLRYEWFEDPEKLNKTQLSPHEIFIRKLRNTKTKAALISKFNRCGLDIKKSIFETNIEATACNWTRKLSILDQCVATRKHAYLQRPSALA